MCYGSINYFDKSDLKNLVALQYYVMGMLPILFDFISQEQNNFKFYVLLTVHLSTVLAIDQLNAQILVL